MSLTCMKASIFFIILLLAASYSFAHNPNDKIEVITDPIYWITEKGITHNELCPYFNHGDGFFSLTPTTENDPLCGGATPKPQDQIPKEIPKQKKKHGILEGWRDRDLQRQGEHTG